MKQPTARSFGHAPVARLAGWCAIGAVIVALSAGGCGEDDKRRWDEFFKPSGGSWFGAAGAGETWTIECNEYLGPAHRQNADTAAQALRRQGRLKPDLVRVEHAEGRSRVFYGEYPLNYAKAGDDTQIVLNDAIKRDLALIRELSLDGQHIFLQARPLPVPTSDVGPPEWNLARARGAYTLHVGVTYPTATLREYKEAAVEWVRDLRSRGYEAYYFHDPDRPQTSICVGSFGEDAFFTEPDGRLAYSQAVKDLQNKEEEFQFNLENGHKRYRITADPTTGNKERIPNFSFLVEIPQPGKPKALRQRRPTTFIPDYE